MGSLPDKEYIGPEMKKIMGPSGDLNFPTLEELSPEARYATSSRMSGMDEN